MICMCYYSNTCLIIYMLICLQASLESERQRADESEKKYAEAQVKI